MLDSSLSLTLLLRKTNTYIHDLKSGYRISANEFSINIVNNGHQEYQKYQPQYRLILQRQHRQGRSQPKNSGWALNGGHLPNLGTQ